MPEMTTEQLGLKFALKTKYPELAQDKWKFLLELIIDYESVEIALKEFEKQIDIVVQKAADNAKQKTINKNSIEEFMEHFNENMNEYNKEPINQINLEAIQLLKDINKRRYLFNLTYQEYLASFENIKRRRARFVELNEKQKEFNDKIHNKEKSVDIEDLIFEIDRLEKLIDLDHTTQLLGPDSPEYDSYQTHLKKLKALKLNLKKLLESKSKQATSKEEELINIDDEIQKLNESIRKENEAIDRHYNREVIIQGIDAIHSLIYFHSKEKLSVVNDNKKLAELNNKHHEIIDSLTEELRELNKIKTDHAEHFKKTHQINNPSLKEKREAALNEAILKKQIKTQEIIDLIGEKSSEITEQSIAGTHYSELFKLDKELRETGEISKPHITAIPLIPVVADFVLGILAIGDAIQNIRNKYAEQRKTKIATSTLIGGTFIGAAIVGALFIAGVGAMATAAAIIATPIVIAAVPLIAYGFSLARHHYILNQTNLAITKTEKNITDISNRMKEREDQLSKINRLDINIQTDPEYVNLAINLTKQKKILSHYNKVKEASEVAIRFNRLNMIAAGFIVAAVVCAFLFPPAAPVLLYAGITIGSISIIGSIYYKVKSIQKNRKEKTITDSHHKNLQDRIKDYFKPSNSIELKNTTDKNVREKIKKSECTNF